MFGPEEVSDKLRARKFNLDTWFSGADFAHTALAQLNSAVRRRSMGMFQQVLSFFYDV